MVIFGVPLRRRVSEAEKKLSLGLLSRSFSDF